MSDDQARIEIRSYRNCFKLERRIHKIDRWQIPIPFGLPLRGVGYAAGVELTLLILARVPVLGAALGAMSPELRFGILPIALAYVLTRWEIDGRPAHAVLRSFARMRARPKRLAGWRAAPSPGTVTFGPITVAPDERSARLRPAVIEGPARVLVRYPFRTCRRWRTLVVEPEPGPPRWRGKEIALVRGQRVVIR
jgi:hypothetical protein